MSNFLRPFIKSGGKFLKPFVGGKQEGQLTEADLELLPYLNQEREKQERESSSFNPLEFVFDLLNRGQYLTANLGQDIAEGKGVEDILKGAWEGAITAKRKGTWKTTLFGGQDPGEEYEGGGIFGKQEALQGKIPLLSDIPIVGETIFKSWEDVIGLAADIFLDPTTYFTFGLGKGATAANKAAARSYAKEAVKRAIFNTGNLNELAKITSKGFNMDTLKALSKQSLKQGEKYLQKHVTAKAMSEFNARVFKTAYKEGLSMTGKEVTDKMLQGIVEGGGEFTERATAKLAAEGQQKAVSRLNALIKRNPGTHDYLLQLKEIATDPSVTKDQLKAVYKGIMEYSTDSGLKGVGRLGDALEQYNLYGGEIARMTSPEFTANFAKLGERKVADLFGKELGKGIRRPNIYARTTSGIGEWIGKSKLGTFGRAVSSWLDNSKLGDIKRAFGIKNPYQQMLNLEKMENHYLASRLISDEINHVESVFGEVDEKLLAKVRDVIDYGKSRGIPDLQELMNDPGVLKMIDLKDVEKIRNWTLSERHLVDEYFLKEQELVRKGLMPPYKPIPNYLPHHNQILSQRKATKTLGPYRPPFTKHQDLSVEYIAKQDAAVVKKFLGVSDEDAKMIVGELGWSTTNMDLKEMLMYRAYAHARAVSNADLVERFVQFGVKPDEFMADPNVMRGLGRAGENVFAGLRQVQTEIPALKGMYFDEDVANIIDKVIPIVSSDRGLRGWGKMISAITTNFKSWATFSPGFNMRNLRSDITTGFINYGVGFLHPGKLRRGALLSAYGIYGENAIRNPSSPVGKFLKAAMGFNDVSINKILNENIAGKTAKQWTDEVMTKTGVISKASMGYDLGEAIEKIGKKTSFAQKANPLSNEDFILFKWSKDLGGVRESSIRAHGFLLDIERTSGKGGIATEGAIQEAVRNVKKYFFDYEDLCFDSETEVLTRRGWLKYSQITYEDEALTFNMITDCLEWQKINHIHITQYTGEMYEVLSKSLNALITPKHRLIKCGGVQGGHHTITKEKYTLREIRQMDDSHVHLKVSSENYNNSIKKEVYSDTMVKIIGWIITEGTYSKKDLGISIYQSYSHNPEYVNEIRELLKEYSDEHTVSEYRLNKTHKNIAQFYIGNNLNRIIRKIMPEKKLTMDFVLSLTNSQTGLLLETIIKADGQIKKYATGGRHCIITQKDEYSCDTIQALAFLCGNRTVKRSKRKYGEDCNTISVLRKGNNAYLNNIEKRKKDYSGIIWCITTDNHTLVARRNGTVYISGNSEFEQKVMKKIIPFYCVPDDTEILTRDGWKTRTEVSSGVEVLTYNVDKNICEWQKVDDIATFHFDGELERLSGSWADFRCTIDHRWPVDVSKTIVKGKHYGGDKKIIRTNDLNTSHKLILSAPIGDQDSVIGERDAAILGWLVTDGYYRWRGNHIEMMIYQSPNKYAKQIKELLGEYLTSESIHPQTDVICFRIAAKYYERIKHIFSGKKDLPGIVTRLSKSSLEAMHQAMFDAEGSTGYTGTTREFRQWGQMAGPVLDAFQIICQLLDKPYGYKTISGDYKSGYIRKKNRLKVADLNRERVKYVGMVWCPKTQNSTWVMRQNGKVICTGNTWLRKNVALQITQLTERTGAMATVSKITGAMKDEDVDEEDLPDYVRRQGGIATGVEDGLARIFFPDLPYKDINMLPFKFEMTESGIPLPKVQWEEAYYDFLSAAHPLFKTVLTTAGQGWDPFRRQQLDSKAPAPRAFRLLGNNPEVFAFIDSAVRAVGFENGLGLEIDKNGKLQMDGKWAKVLEDNVLLIKRLDDIGDSILTVFPELDKALETLTGIKPRYEDMDKVFKTMSFSLGLSQRDIDMDKQEEYRFRDALKRAEERRTEARRRTPGGQRRSEQYYRAYEKRTRKLRSATR